MKLDKIINQPVIETERFDLRPLRRSDKGLIEHYGSDERVAKMTTSIPHPLPPGMVEGFIARACSEERDEDVWAIDGTKSGGSELKGFDFSSKNGSKSNRGRLLGCTDILEYRACIRSGRSIGSGQSFGQSHDVCQRFSG